MSAGQTIATIEAMKMEAADHRTQRRHRGAGGGVEHRAGRGRRPAGGAQLTRIIGGVAGGRRIAVPPRGTRPTTDRVRESLFNIVTARRDLTGLAVLDLYAGSGALGLEALSRGAASALFVESDQRTAAVIARNIETLGLAGATLRRGAVAAVLAGGAVSPVDLVLADPPYDVETAEIEALLAALHPRLGARGHRRGGRACGGRRGADLAGRLGRYGNRACYGDTRLELAERV